MVEVSVYEHKCPYCKKQFKISKKKDSNDIEKTYQEHLKNCKEYKKSWQDTKKTLELYKELEKEGLLSQSEIKLLLFEDIEKDIKKLMRKYQVDGEQLIEIIESLN